MNVSLVALLVGALAVWEMIEIWRHSSLLAGLRARAELLEGKLGELLRCGFCLSVWLGMAVVPFIIPGDTTNETWHLVKTAGGMVLVGFAVARLANLGNDLTHAWCRTPRDNKLEEPAEGSEKFTEARIYLETAAIVALLKYSPKADVKTTIEKETGNGGRVRTDQGHDGVAGPHDV